ncbi:tetratricopeptide repeat protein [Streptomyces sp. MJM1172]|uniref:tetratricopeptide repeat protein n=1 Tax=Streptomyces sp. MJM1172 TaxID=1703926 RepID=UPI0009A1D849|nr:tetratricopeptide repeat protein [Streptomyces sp. MJM1172]
MTGKKPGRKWRDLPATTAPEVRRLSEFLRARVDESGKTLNDLAPVVGNATSVISTYLGGKIPNQRFVTALIAATAPASLREKHTGEALRLLDAALHPPRRPTGGSQVGPSASGLMDINAVQAQHLETYAHLTRALEQHNEVRQAAANSEKLMWVLYGMVGKLEERVARLTEERDRLGKGSEAAERKLTRALGQQHRAESELSRAREKQREAEDLAARLQERIDHLTSELDRLHPSSAEPLPDVAATECPSGGEDPEGDDIEAALARAEAVNDSDSVTVARIATELAAEANIVPNNAVASANTANTPGAALAVLHEHALEAGYAGDPQKARDLFAELVLDHVRALGASHPNTLSSRHNLAHWTGEAGDPQKAGELFAELVPANTNILGAEHPSTLSSRHEHARMVGEAGDPQKARDLLAELVPDRTRVLGADHPDTLASRYNLAHWIGEAGHPQTARDLLASLVTDYTRVLGLDHPNTLACRQDHAHMIGLAGDATLARNLFADLVPEYSRVLGPHHRDTSCSRHNLAHWIGANGDPQTARDLLTSLVTEYTVVLGPDHPNTLAARHGQARVIGAAGDQQTAEGLFAELVPDRIRVLGLDHPDTIASRDALAHWRGQA